ncbi:MAG: response regulator [Bacillota bacterium]
MGKARVLIVDDAAFMRNVLRGMLEKNGYEVVGEGGNGKQGVDLYSSLRPDVVTMDITMPEMEGIEALAAIRKIDPVARVIMVSAMGQTSFVKDALINGAKDFIVKPFQEPRVVKALLNAVGA